MLRVPFFFLFSFGARGFFFLSLSLSLAFSLLSCFGVCCVCGGFLPSLVPWFLPPSVVIVVVPVVGLVVVCETTVRNETKRNDMRVYVRATSTSAKIQKQKHQLTSKDRKQVSKQASGISKPVSPVSLQEEEKKEKKKNQSAVVRIAARRKEEKEGGVVVVGGWLCGVCARKGSAIRLLVSPPGR